MSNRADASVSQKILIVADILGVLIAWTPSIVTWSAVIYFLHQVWNEALFFLWTLLLPLLAFAVFLTTIVLIRLSLPRLKPGVYTVNSMAMKAWYMHFMLVNSLNVSGLLPLVYCTYFTRWLYFRAMGARIDYGVHLSIHTRFREFPLIRIGKGSSLSADVHISCHTHVGDKLMLAPVEIGEKCFIGMGTVIGPKTSLGEGTWIGFGNRIIMERMPAGSKLENFEWAHGNPARLKNKADESAES